MEFESEYFDCRIDLSTTRPLQPGQTIVAPVVFVEPQLIVPRLWRGAAFFLWEGRRIADGLIEEIPAQALFHHAAE